MSFFYENGYLYCEELRVKKICDQISRTPFYLYSAQTLRKNLAAYSDAIANIPAVISYAIKANANLHILSILCQQGCWATLVSGGELQLAMAAGFDPKHMIYNGNGKTIPELKSAAGLGVLINIDSEFDLEHIQQAAALAGKSVDVLLRINPDIDPDVHPFISTGVRNSKFGISLKELPALLARLKLASALNLVGLHCHLGSTITNLAVFRQIMELMSDQFEVIHSQGFRMKYLNIGGGLGIDYLMEKDEFPTPADLVSVLIDLIPEDATLILEPGRSIVGSAGVLICSVIGVKQGETRNFIVTDGSMAELIRPSLYDAYHRIDFIEPVVGPIENYDIVGPVCESADFLGKDRALPSPEEGAGVVVYDTGAYGYAMSSNYNLRLRPAEVLVDGKELILIRRAESYEDHMRLFNFGTKGFPAG